MSDPKRKEHPDLFWEHLVEARADPARLVPLLPGWTEFEIAAELTKARIRLAVDAADARRRELSEEIGTPAAVGSNFAFPCTKLISRALGRGTKRR